MFITDNINETEFNAYMGRLKCENQEFKSIIRSNKYRVGVCVSDFLGAFKSIQNTKKYMKSIFGKFRWQYLCTKYPIVHNGIMDTDRTPCYFSRERIAIYTCIFGDYDLPQEPLFKPDNCDYFIITDQELKNNTVWKTIDPEEIIPDFSNMSNVLKNRYCKMMPHIIFKDYRYSIYIDGNVKVITDLTEFINIPMTEGILFHRHKARKCIYDEIEACKILKKAPESALDEFYEFLKGENFPREYGMVECNVIVRDHSNNKQVELMEEWWSYFNRFSVKRDQLSMAFLLWKHGISVDKVDKLGINVEENPAIRVTLHKLEHI